MNKSEAAHRRRGGRDARRELRAAPIPEAKRAVRPGMEGGDYKPLSDAEVERIHRAALDILEQIGFSDAIPSCIELFTAAGATLTDEGRLLVPRALVEDTLAKAARHFVYPSWHSVRGDVPLRAGELLEVSPATCLRGLS